MIGKWLPILLDALLFKSRITVWPLCTFERKALFVSTTCTRLLGHPLFEKNFKWEQRTISTLSLFGKRTMLLATSLLVIFAHFIPLNLNYTSCGFLFDIADLLIIIDTPLWNLYSKPYLEVVKTVCYIAGVPGVYLNQASIRAPASIKETFS
jgi:hypothetical protein